MSGKALVIGEYRSKRQRPLAVRRRPQLRRGRLLVLVAFAVILLAGVGLAGRRSDQALQAIDKGGGESEKCVYQRKYRSHLPTAH